MQREFIGKWNTKTNFLLATGISFIATLAAAVVTWLAPLNPYFRLNVNDSLTWWALNPYYYWLIWVPLVAASLYMAVWLGVRQVHMVHGLSRIYATYKVVAKPFHPDHCNGFAAVGDYAMRSTIIVIVGGFWLTFLIIQPALFQEALHIRTDLIIMMLLYAITVPALFTIPVWSTHRVMAHAKSLALDAVGRQIRQALQHTQGSQGSSPQALERVQGLCREYELIEREYRTWPFHKVTLGGFGATALLPPLVTALVSYLSTAALGQP